MFKRVGVLTMALASLGALVPATAAAAERGRDEARIVVQKKVVRHRGHQKAQRVVVKRVVVRESAPKWR
jgi:hypothetical protein